MLTLAYLGNGKSTNRYHLPFVLTLQDYFHVKSIFARSQSTTWEKVPNIDYVDSIDSILNDESVDAVVITTPHATHFELAMRVLKSGKHCLVEKPFTTTLEEATILFDYAASQNLVVMPYQNRRYDADLLTLKKLIEEKTLGELYDVTFTWDSNRGMDSESFISGNVENSLVYGLGTHSLDQALATFGIPKDYKALAMQSMGPGSLNDSYAIDLIYDTLHVSVKGTLLAAKSRPVLSAYGSKGSYIRKDRDVQERNLKDFILPGMPGFGIESFEDQGMLFTKDKQKSLPSVVGSYSDFYRMFYEVIQGKASFDSAIILKQLEILEACYKTLK